MPWAFPVRKEPSLHIEASQALILARGLIRLTNATALKPARIHKQLFCDFQPPLDIKTAHRTEFTLFDTVSTTLHKESAGEASCYSCPQRLVDHVCGDMLEQAPNFPFLASTLFQTL